MGANSWLTTRMTALKLRLAALANKYLGCELLYWTAPMEWESYMMQGEPLTKKVYERSESDD